MSLDVGSAPVSRCAAALALAACAAGESLDHERPDRGLAGLRGKDALGSRFRRSPRSRARTSTRSSSPGAPPRRLLRRQRRRDAAPRSGATPIVVDDTLYFCTASTACSRSTPRPARERWSFDPQRRNRKLEGPYPLRVPRRRLLGGARRRPSARERCGRAHPHGHDRLRADRARRRAPARRARTSARTGASTCARASATAPRPGSTTRPRRRSCSATSPWSARSSPTTCAPTRRPASCAPSTCARGALRWAWDPVPPGSPAPQRRASRLPARHAERVVASLGATRSAASCSCRPATRRPTSTARVGNGLDYYGSSVVALRASTGEVAWHFQTVHHDVWDYDVPAQPTLFELERRRAARRRRRADHEDGPPVPARPRDGRAALSRSRSGPCRRAACRARRSRRRSRSRRTRRRSTRRARARGRLWLHAVGPGEVPREARALRNEGIFTPPSARGLDRLSRQRRRAELGRRRDRPGARASLYVNQMRAATVVQLVPRAEFDALRLEGARSYPTELYPMAGHAVRRARAARCSRRFGAPCTRRRGARSTAVDLATGEMLWESRSARRATRRRSRSGSTLGAPNLGGSLATASGLVFIGATTDKYFRAFDADTGDEIWRARTPVHGERDADDLPAAARRPPVRRDRRRRPRLVASRATRCSRSHCRRTGPPARRLELDDRPRRARRHRPGRRWCAAARSRRASCDRGGDRADRARRRRARRGAGALLRPRARRAPSA